MAKSFVHFNPYTPNTMGVCACVLAVRNLPETKIQFDRLKYLNKLDIARQRISTLGNFESVLRYWIYCGNNRWNDNRDMDLNMLKTLQWYLLKI